MGQTPVRQNQRNIRPFNNVPKSTNLKVTRLTLPQDDIDIKTTIFLKALINYVNLTGQGRDFMDIYTKWSDICTKRSEELVLKWEMREGVWRDFPLLPKWVGNMNYIPVPNAAKSPPRSLCILYILIYILPHLIDIGKHNWSSQLNFFTFIQHLIF